MTDESGAFRREYADAFRSHLRAPGEVGLQAAYLLGRRAVEVGISVLDLADAHHEVLIGEIAASGSTGDATALAGAARTFFNETLSTFDMASRGFREASQTARLEHRHALRLRLLAEAFLELNGSLSPRQILEVVAARTVGILDVASVRVRLALDDLDVHDVAGGTTAEIDEELARRALIDGVPVRGDAERIVLVAPVLPGGRSAGVIQLVGSAGTAFGDQEEAILVQLASMTAVAVENAVRYEHEHQIAATLQRSLLPERVPRLEGTEIAVRYLAGGHGVDVGGDFYDVVELGPTRVALALGDVMGKGIRAAATMGQLRMALRAYASDGRPPALVVAGLDRLMAGLSGDAFATMVYLDIDLIGRVGRLVVAGHPSPILRNPDGECRLLEAPVSPPVGLMGEEPRDVEVALDEGSLLLLYSDGLVEGRSLPVSEGMALLSEAVCDAPADAEGVCDHVLEAMRGLTGEDDTALLACGFTGRRPGPTA